MKIVPNEQPKFHNQPYKIAIVGEAPGSMEEETGHPFVGPSGNLLWSVASKYGIVREACFVGNVCMVRPPSNDISFFDWNGPEIQQGLRQLADDLIQFKPNLVVCLGNSPLKAFRGESGISSWRGSLFHGNLRTTQQYKCLATLHPAGILRDYTGLPLLHFDLKRARQEGESPELDLPKRSLMVDWLPDMTLELMEQVIEKKPTIAIDIEGGIDSMSCISIATSPTSSFIVPCNASYWGDLEWLMWKTLSKLLEDPSIPKILQNSLYDLFVLQYSYRIPVRGVVQDTMLKHWELYCELPKSLGFQCSIYTKEPYYKEDRHAEDRQTFYEYCCRDSATTYEIDSVLEKQLNGPAKAHYLLNMSLLEPLLYMELKGINYDSKKAKEKLEDRTHKIHRLQWALNEIAGIKNPTNVSGWVDICRDVLCFKRDTASVNLVQDIVPHSKLTCLHLAQRATEVLRGDLGIAASGELSILTEQCLNVESKKQMADFLYRQLMLPIQYKKEHGKLTDKETTDVLALLTLYKKTQDPTLKLVLTIRALRTRCDTLKAGTDGDGRIRCAYNIVGTETGRLTCYESPTGSGFNLQTVTKKDRDLFLPDEGHYIFQCDLSGADGWTVAAHCLSCGDDAMLEDYQFGLKPARIIALIYQKGGTVLKWSREQIKDEGRSIDSDGWLYFACKRVQHGSNYGMGGQTMSDQVLKDSYKLLGEPIFVDKLTCEQLQRFYLARYPGILRWHEKCKQRLIKDGYLVSANGHRRVFWGRKKDPNGKVNHETFKQFLADEPQNNTTYATNLALYKLWTDTDNRLTTEATQSTGLSQSPTTRINLRIQPLHQVHDALIGQFRKDDTEWAKPKIRSYFNNELTISGVKITIPFEGNYGESWGSLKQGTI